jgi:hypothetical protein
VYSIDKDTRVIVLSNLPAQDSGAPSPRVIAAENNLILTYITQGSDDVAVLSFRQPFAHLFGPPNDEALRGHPLYALGLRPYDNSEVLGSPWTRELERRNRVHPNHNPKRFDAFRHFVFTFHDSIFECLALDVITVGVFRIDGGSDRKLLELIGDQLGFIL